MKLWVVLLAVVLTFVGWQAHAKRMGAGKSVGQQSTHVVPSQGKPAVTQQAADASASKSLAPAQAAPSNLSSWGAMFKGLAAGLGLAWLAHALGFGEGFAQFLLAAGAVLLVLLLVRWWLSQRKALGAGVQSTPFAYQAGGAAARIASTKNYRPENVGNDASARPWERHSMLFEDASAGSMIGSRVSHVPEDFDREAFLQAAKANFVTLQAAWDQANVPVLRSMMTDAMLQEIHTQLAERAEQACGVANVTDVVMIDARLLGIEDRAHEYMASVEFSGMIREEPSAGPSPFREVWNMTKSKTGAHGWLVAGVQALQ